MQRFFLLHPPAPASRRRFVPRPRLVLFPTALPSNFYLRVTGKAFSCLNIDGRHLSDSASARIFRCLEFPGAAFSIKVLPNQEIFLRIYRVDLCLRICISISIDESPNFFSMLHATASSHTRQFRIRHSVKHVFYL